MRLSLAVFLPALALPVVVASAQAPVQIKAATLPRTPAGETASAWLNAFDSGDSTAIANLVRDHFDPAALGGRPLDAIIARERWRARNLGPAQVVRVDAASDTSISVLVRHAAVDGWGHLKLRVRGDSSHRVTSLALSRMEAPPADLAEHGALSDADIAKALDDFVARLTADGRFSGTVGVVHHGKLLMSRAYGMANRDRHIPNTIDTRFQLASVGKLFTTVAIARLAEQGVLSYEDTLGRWIPEYPNRSAARFVTLRHLLTHSSGIADYFMNPAWDAMDKEALNARPLEEHFRFFAADSLRFTPGTRTAYSNANFLLLGIVAERAGRAERYRELFRRRVFEPARMSTTWQEPGVAPRATGYTWFGPMRALDPSHERIAVDEPVTGTPAGGGITTIGDMTRFAAGLLDGTLLSRNSLETLVARHGIDETPTSWAAYGFDSVEEWRGVRVANKSGSTYGTHSQFDVYPDEGYGVVVLSNLETWGSEAVIYKARELITRR